MIDIQRRVGYVATAAAILAIAGLVWWRTRNERDTRQDDKDDELPAPVTSLEHILSEPCSQTEKRIDGTQTQTKTETEVSTAAQTATSTATHLPELIDISCEDAESRSMDAEASEDDSEASGSHPSTTNAVVTPSPTIEVHEEEENLFQLDGTDTLPAAVTEPVLRSSASSHSIASSIRSSTLDAVPPEDTGRDFTSSPMVFPSASVLKVESKDLLNLHPSGLGNDSDTPTPAAAADAPEPLGSASDIKREESANVQSLSGLPTDVAALPAKKPLPNLAITIPPLRPERTVTATLEVWSTSPDSPNWEDDEEVILTITSPIDEDDEKEVPSPVDPSLLSPDICREMYKTRYEARQDADGNFGGEEVLIEGYYDEDGEFVEAVYDDVMYGDSGDFDGQMHGDFEVDEAGEPVNDADVGILKHSQSADFAEDKAGGLFDEEDVHPLKHSQSAPAGCPIYAVVEHPYLEECEDVEDHINSAAAATAGEGTETDATPAAAIESDLSMPEELQCERPQSAAAGTATETRPGKSRLNPAANAFVPVFSTPIPTAHPIFTAPSYAPSVEAHTYSTYPYLQSDAYSSQTFGMTAREQNSASDIFHLRNEPQQQSTHHVGSKLNPNATEFIPGGVVASVLAPSAPAFTPRRSTQSRPPSRKAAPTTPQCIFGTSCANKSNCAYAHGVLCRYYPSCKYGAMCKYIHPEPPAPTPVNGRTVGVVEL
ncbi:uncharacterized protein EV422DRAFT_570911 [Fimicolochytrium jonesii]|uniref:uncharacterized protein n=1 Tax=Fimicolochytrium jonesii TaxID=1396493 RepID=UPI0022FDD2B8|nr:uncharacterized protein EV422DRAFT_570911 [Fimicolochytrium jonesii]KAI8817287.1 hypothetical protein EV422DRAFT_570911 [Fimicolochytrium jonesii]